MPSERSGRLSTLKTAYTIARKQDAKLPLYVFGSALLALAVFIVLSFFLHPQWLWIFLGVLFALSVGMFVFGRRANTAAYASVEGQPGAAVSVVENMRGYWRVTPMVGFTRDQDVVHRVIGPPGIVLVGEGNPRRLTGLLTDQKRRIGRVVNDVPITDVIVGNEDGQVPLRKLQSKLTRMPRTYKPQQLRVLEGRMRAIDVSGGPPIPKGPLPKGMRMPKMPNR